MQTNNNQPQNALTLPFEVEDYLACKTMQGLAPGTIENYRLILTLFFRSTNKLPNEIITNDIRRFLYNYQEKKKISRVTLDKYREYISRFFLGRTKKASLLPIQRRHSQFVQAIFLLSKEINYISIPPFSGGGGVNNAINFYDSSFTCLGQFTDAGVGYGMCSGHVDEFKTIVENGISILDLINNTVLGVENIAFVRITNDYSKAKGDKMIITKNEEIPR